MRQYKEQGWSKCEIKAPYKSMAIPKRPAVYLIVVKSTRRKIVYVGSTLCLYNRVGTHQIINLIKRNINKARIEVWYKNFNGASRNLIKEKNLIKELNPIFNGISENREGKFTDRTYAFWKRMGVSRIKINQWRTDKVY